MSLDLQHRTGVNAPRLAAGACLEVASACTPASVLMTAHAGELNSLSFCHFHGSEVEYHYGFDLYLIN